MLKRCEQKVQTRENLFEASIELFNRNGVENTKITDIVKQANVAVGTFYVHFKSKEDLISAIYYEGLNNFMNIHIKEISQCSLTLKELLVKIGLLEFDFAQSVGVEVTTIAFSANLQTNMRKPGNHLKKREFSNEIQKIITNRANKTMFDKDLIFKEFETIIRGVMLTWCFDNGKSDIHELGEKLLTTALQNI
ncbi:TetR/AcrR family transcriptional regulator [Liquorilactobacillus mali]|uniref:HTH tetR-type domain-containing protein n=1 Tax=Liquorilactobacillus mali TaxID=1618 RepID=A0A0R2FNY6_9LACO|nr:TetR/AcrR family transcriptional regulator [Liquorilactobacillus mali]KRN26650.1 hypothetical protein IV36_GL001634 [Liquorilactobacillus mali]MDN7145646.1 TetR/AcrR family transcriptional regulator [Liquorilactobacillus mali]